MGLKMFSRSKFDRRIGSERVALSYPDVERGEGRLPVFGCVQTFQKRPTHRVRFYQALPVLVLLWLAIFGIMNYAEAQWPLGKDLTGQEAKTESTPNVTGSGRFQIFVSSQAKGYTFMLDTDTGRVWIMKKDHTSGEFSLNRVPVDQVDPQTVKGQPEKTEKKDKAKAPD